jgi:hypothetical protein
MISRASSRVAFVDPESEEPCVGRLEQWNPGSRPAVRAGLLTRQMFLSLAPGTRTLVRIKPAKDKAAIPTPAANQDVPRLLGSEFAMENERSVCVHGLIA